MCSILDGNSIFSSFSSFWNALLYTLVSDEGNETVVRLLQFSKVLSSMVFTPEGIFMLVRLEHPLKAYSPIFSKNVGIVRSV